MLVEGPPAKGSYEEKFETDFGLARRRGRRSRARTVKVRFNARGFAGPDCAIHEAE